MINFFWIPLIPFYLIAILFWVPFALVFTLYCELCRAFGLTRMVIPWSMFRVETKYNFWS